MKLTVLADNNTYIDQYYLGEPAACYYLQDGPETVLFDTGYSDVYLKNAAALGINLADVGTVVLSHGHNDHTGGLRFFPAGKKNRLVAHPSVFEDKRCLGLSISAPCSREETEKKFELCLSAEPMRITEHLYWLGEIPRLTAFENRCPVGERRGRERWEPDFLKDDSALVSVDRDGLTVITGCSHSGICNMILQAQKVTGVKKVNRVIGGFHLMDPLSEQLPCTVDFLEQERIPELYPCHCTCFAARAAIHSRCPVKEVGVGLVLEWE